MIEPNKMPEGMEQEMETEMESPETETETGVDIPEEFQTQICSIIDTATKSQLQYIRDCIMRREDAMRKEEQPAKSTKPTDFSTEGMPL